MAKVGIWTAKIKMKFNDHRLTPIIRCRLVSSQNLLKPERKYLINHVE